MKFYTYYTKEWVGDSAKEFYYIGNVCGHFTSNNIQDLAAYAAEYGGKHGYLEVLNRSMIGVDVLKDETCNERICYRRGEYEIRRPLTGEEFDELSKNLEGLLLGLESGDQNE